MSAGTKIASGMAALLAASWSLGAQAASPAVANACANYASEAANRSGLPIDIVLRVMMAESGGNPRIVSSKGAMGCMQIMPATWSYLSGRYRLGANPFDARMNMIGGAMYLAELSSRYGWPGALSAYNAGPGRYQRYVRNRVPLPAETSAYTARLGGKVDPRPTVVLAPRWQEASLFLARRPLEEVPEQPAQIAFSAAAKGGLTNPLFPLSPGPEQDEKTGVAR
ncbi:lytic transglycosylase domain-containing protein [Sphingomonas montanisoli]|uniref:Lytic transglycosylase domain-containing protein n=1 Tax=Sphingomonas montanisoli TaxID=2606412 RepID=A0A5D9C3U2_9SPHN|nr:lytic transglycosylase domain-containing protein [Sphingomonas montanisoli]TZG26518.1 lytic transglycosylase domain-containing protein [Sphingomonas montanisoli]